MEGKPSQRVLAVLGLLTTYRLLRDRASRTRSRKSFPVPLRKP